MFVVVVAAGASPVPSRGACPWLVAGSTSRWRRGSSCAAPRPAPARRRPNSRGCAPLGVRAGGRPALRGRASACPKPDDRTRPRMFESALCQPARAGLPLSSAGGHLLHRHELPQVVRRHELRHRAHLSGVRTHQNGAINQGIARRKARQTGCTGTRGAAGRA